MQHTPGLMKADSECDARERGRTEVPNLKADPRF